MIMINIETTLLIAIDHDGNGRELLFGIVEIYDVTQTELYVDGAV